MKRATPCYDIHEACRSFGLDPDEWSGTMRVYCVGKTGEALFSLGLVPGLRYLLPRARLAWHVAPHYQPAFKLVEATWQPDEVHDHQLPPGTDSWAERVRRAAVGEGLQDCERIVGIVFDEERNEIACNLYRTHFWYFWDDQRAGRRTPFYLAFAEAAGLPVPLYEPPRPIERQQDGGIVLAFPTANEHSKLRILPLTPAEWGRLADAAEAAELAPVATGRPEDGRPEMPGWTWDESTGVAPVLAAVARSQWTFGLNSGIVFSALLLGPWTGHVSMVDPQAMPIYDWSWMHGVVDGTRHRRIAVHPVREREKIARWLVNDEMRRALVSRRVPDDALAKMRAQRDAFDAWLRKEYRR